MKFLILLFFINFTIHAKDEVRIPTCIILGDTLFSNNPERGNYFQYEDFSLWNIIFSAFKHSEGGKLGINVDDSLQIFAYFQNFSDQDFTKLIYLQYGGYVTFNKIRSFGKCYYPNDAYRKYYEEQVRNGNLKFLNEGLEKYFWRSFDIKVEDLVEVDFFIQSDFYKFHTYLMLNLRRKESIL